uniref:Ovule protein n=1 Tax=Angiostrongylus cantonensis TaxID=6313 RepID=A0A0K0CXU3_ANGCA
LQVSLSRETGRTLHFSFIQFSIIHCHILDFTSVIIRCGESVVNWKRQLERLWWKKLYVLETTVQLCEQRLSTVDNV